MIPLLVLLVTIFITVIIFSLFSGRMHELSRVKEFHNPIFLRVSVPKNGNRYTSAEKLFNSIFSTSGNIKSSSIFSFEIFANDKGIFFIIGVESRYKDFVETQIYASYPEAHIQILADPLVNFNNNKPTIIEIKLKESSQYPIKTYGTSDFDPVSTLMALLSKLQPGDCLLTQLVVTPADNQWRVNAQKTIQNIKKNERTDKTKISDYPNATRFIEHKITKPGLYFSYRIIVASANPDRKKIILDDTLAVINQLEQFQSNKLVQFNEPKANVLIKLIDSIIYKIQNKSKLPKFKTRALKVSDENILNIEEASTIFHLPEASAGSSKIDWVASKKLEPPTNLPIENARLFGFTQFRDQSLLFGIKPEDRRRHMYLLGKTGTGKSLFIKNMALTDIYDGKGVCVIDPHGDLVEEILNLIPENRKQDVVYLDPSDTEFPIAINMLDMKESESKELIADGIVSVFIKLFGNSWGPRLQYILTNTIMTLLHCQNVSLLAVQRILIDKNYRKFLLKQVHDPFLKKFWNEEYELMSRNPKLISETISPIQNKVGRFLSSPMVRNMIGQIKSSIDLSEIMNSNKIFLVNLSQGKIGEENSSLLGAMLITRLYTNAMQRAKLPIEQRKDFYLFVDEFQNFATDTFVKILSEARKYGLNLLVTHQFIDQVEPGIQDAIFGNVGTIINYVVGPKDAARLEKEYRPDFSTNDLINLPKFNFAIKMMIDGTQSKPFTGSLAWPKFVNFNFGEEIKNISRENFCSERAVVELKLKKWANQQYDKEGRLVQVEVLKRKAKVKRGGENP